MPKRRRWDPCLERRGSEVGPFIAEYFGASERNVLLIAGAGFDPRSTFVCAQLASVVTTLRGLLIQEERPNATYTLVARANANTQQLIALLTDYEVAAIDIFGTNNAVVGGRNVVNAVHSQDLDEITDIVVDLSALSVGTSYPIVRYFRAIGGGNDSGTSICSSRQTRRSTKQLFRLPAILWGSCMGSKEAGRSTPMRRRRNFGCRSLRTVDELRSNEFMMLWRRMTPAPFYRSLRCNRDWATRLQSTIRPNSKARGRLIPAM